MSIQNNNSGTWIHEDIYKPEFIKRQITKILLKSLSGVVTVSMVLVCSKPLILSKAYADNNSTAAIETRQSKYNTGADEQTEGEDYMLPLTDNNITDESDDFINASDTFDLDEDIETPVESEEPSDIAEEPVEEIIPILETMTVPNWIAGCKSYNITHMDYRAVTNKASKQYSLLNSSEAYTEESTGLRMIDGRIAIALGLGFNVSVGDYVNVVFENGYEFECIVGDIKDNKDTDNTHRFQKYDGSVVEAITDRHIFTGTKDYPEGFKGTIDQIVRLDKTFEF